MLKYFIYFSSIRYQFKKAKETIHCISKIYIQMTPTLKSKRYCQNYNFQWLIPVIHFHRVTGSVVSNGAQGIKRQA